MSTRPQEDSFLSKSLSGDEDEPQKFSEYFFPSSTRESATREKKENYEFFSVISHASEIIIIFRVSDVSKKGGILRYI